MGVREVARWINTLQERDNSRSPAPSHGILRALDRRSRNGEPRSSFGAGVVSADLASALLHQVSPDSSSRHGREYHRQTPAAHAILDHVSGVSYQVTVARLAPFALAVVTGALIGALAAGWIGEIRYGAARLAERDALLTALGQDVVVAHAALRVLAPDPLTRALAGSQGVHETLKRQAGEGKKGRIP